MPHFALHFPQSLSSQCRFVCLVTLKQIKQAVILLVMSGISKKKLLKRIERFEKLHKKRTIDTVVECEFQEKQDFLRKKEGKKEKNQDGGSRLEKVLEDAKNALWNVNEFFYNHIWISAVAFEAGLIAEYCSNPKFFSVQDNATLTFYEKYNPVAYVKQSENSLIALPFYAGYLQRAFTGAIKYLSGLKQELAGGQNKKTLLEQMKISREFISKNPNLFGDFCGASTFSIYSALALPYYYVLSKWNIEFDISYFFTANGFISSMVGMVAYLFTINPKFFRNKSILHERERAGLALAQKYPEKDYEERIKALALDFNHSREFDLDKLLHITEIDYNTAIDCLEKRINSKSIGDYFARFLDNYVAIPWFETQRSEREFKQLKERPSEDTTIYRILPLVRLTFLHLFLENYPAAIKSWERILKECKTRQERSEILCLAAKSIELSGNAKHKRWAGQKWRELVEEYKTLREFFNESSQKFEATANNVYVVGDRLMKNTIVVKEATEKSDNDGILNEHKNLLYFRKHLGDRIPRVLDYLDSERKSLIIEHKGVTLYDYFRAGNISEAEKENLLEEAVVLLADIHHYGKAGQLAGEIRLEKQRHSIPFYENRLRQIFFNNLFAYLEAKGAKLPGIKEKAEKLLEYSRPTLSKISKSSPEFSEFYYKDANLRNWCISDNLVVALDFEKSIMMQPQMDLISLLEFDDKILCNDYQQDYLMEKYIDRMKFHGQNLGIEEFGNKYVFYRFQRHLELAGYRIRDMLKGEECRDELDFQMDAVVASLVVLPEKVFSNYEACSIRKLMSGLREIRWML